MWVWSLGWEDPLRRKWQPSPVFLPGKSHRQRSLVGYSPWVKKSQTQFGNWAHMLWLWRSQSVSQFRRSVLSDSATPWIAARQASLFIANSRSLLKLMSIELVMPSNCLILCHPLLLLPSIFPSIRVFSSESVLRVRWPKDWSFSFSISLFNEYSGLISFRMDWLDLLAVQGTLKSLLQHHSSRASILQCSAFFIENILSLSNICLVCLIIGVLLWWLHFSDLL